MILVIDNYDSFTWNLVDLLLRVRTDVKVVRNDEATLDEIKAMHPEGILISPGPGRPEDSKLSVAVCREFLGKTPILGICLGHQLLGQLMDVPVVLAAAPMHGKTTQVAHDNKGLFSGLPNPMRVMRYHSLVLSNNPPPHQFEVTAWTSTQEIMGIRHKIHKFAGVQFHPESILTEEGEKIIRNWITSL